MSREPGKSLVSVVIPAYNCARYVGEAVESVLAQTYQNWEIVVVDSSSDGTKDVLRPFMGRLTYLYQAPRGVAAARNAGITGASGEFVAFLDADDAWMPGFLECGIRALNRYPTAALAFSNGYRTDPHGRTLRPLLPTEPEAFWGWIGKYGNLASGVVEGHWYGQLLMRNFVHTSSVTVRKACLDGTGGFDEGLSYGDDYDLWLQLARRNKFVFVNAPLATYRLHAEGLSGSDSVRGDRWEQEHVKIRERELGHVPPELRRMLRRRIAASYWRLGWVQFHRNQLQGARPMFRRCLHYEKLHWRAWAYAAASFLPGKGVEAIRGIRRWRRGVLSRLSRSSGTSGCWPRSW